MAQLTHSTRTAVSPFRKAESSPRLDYFLPSSAVAGTGVIKYGQVVIFDLNTATNNHKIVRASTATPVLSTTIVGIAAEDDPSSGSSVATQKIGVYMADANTEFKFPTHAAGSAHTSSLIGKRRALGFESTSNYHFFDTGNSSAGDGFLICTGIVDEGTTNGFVVAKFASTGVSAVLGRI